jgi:hypothetical protein
MQILGWLAVIFLSGTTVTSLIVIGNGPPSFASSPSDWYRRMWTIQIVKIVIIVILLSSLMS